MKRAFFVVNLCVMLIVMLAGCRAILDRIIPPTEAEPVEAAFIEATATVIEATQAPTAEPTPTTPIIEPTAEPVEEAPGEAAPEPTTAPQQVTVQSTDQALNGFTCSSNLAPASDLAVVASWEVGDSRLIEVAKRHTQTLNGDVQIIESVTEVRVTVLEVADDGFVLEWVFGETSIDLPPSTVDVAIGNGVLQRLGTVLEGTRVEYATDRLGIYRGLRNVEEISNHKDTFVTDLAEKILAQSPDEDTQAVATEIVDKILGSSQQIEVAFAQDIQLYHALLGSTLGSENPVLFASLVPTFFGSDVIPSLSQISLAGYDADEACAVAQMKGKVDGERAKQAILASYNKNLEANGLAAVEAGSDLAITLEEESQYHIDTISGWPRSLEHQRTVVVGDAQISEKTFIIDKSDGATASATVIDSTIEAEAGGATSTGVTTDTIATGTITDSIVSTSTEQTVTVPTVEVPTIDLPSANPFPNAFVGIANGNANLRSGPSTDNDRVRGIKGGDIVFVVDQNGEGDWYLLDDDTWIAAFLVDRASDEVAATTTPPFPIAGTLNEAQAGSTGTGAVPVIPIPSIGTTDVSISGTASITGTTAISATGVITPTPQPLTDRGNPLLTEEEKDNAVKAILQIPLIEDAVIVQDELTLSLIIGVKNEADAETAQQVGDNFVRLVKAYSNVEPKPDQLIGEGVYDYYIYVVTPAGNDAAIGIKTHSEAEISW